MSSETLINIDNSGHNKRIEFMKTVDGTTMKMIVAPSGHITLSQVDGYGELNTINMHFRSFLAMLEVMDIPYEEAFGNYEIVPVFHTDGGIV